MTTIRARLGWIALLACWATAPAADAQVPASLAPGIYYRLPRLDDPAAEFARVGDAPAAIQPRIKDMAPVGWDACAGTVAMVRPDINSLSLVSVAGEQRLVTPNPGIFSPARPALSSDFRFAAFQASATPFGPNRSPGVNEDFNIYATDLMTGATRRVSPLSWNEESPRFVPGSHRIAYSSFSPTDGVNLHVFDLDQNKEVTVFKNLGAVQIAIAPDGKSFIDPGKMRIYALDSGKVIADLRDRAVAALKAAGFDLDMRFNDPDHGFPDRGVYPLDAAFSPDGQSLVLDWAVKKGTATGNILATVKIDGTGFKVISDLIPTNPKFTNSNNYSQLNPLWK
jgi:hypothetical protein